MGERERVCVEGVGRKADRRYLLRASESSQLLFTVSDTWVVTNIAPRQVVFSGGAACYADKKRRN